MYINTNLAASFGYWLVVFSFYYASNRGFHLSAQYSPWSLRWWIIWCSMWHIGYHILLTCWLLLNIRKSNCYLYFYNKLLSCTSVYKENKPTRYMIFHLVTTDPKSFGQNVHQQRSQSNYSKLWRQADLKILNLNIVQKVILIYRVY